jgi:hypothetical protein
MTFMSALGYSPLLPSSYVADSSGPLLKRWFIDRSSYKAVYLFFDEPVITRLNISIVLSLGLPTPSSSTYNVNITSITYPNDNTEVEISLPEVCLPSITICSTTLMQTIKSSTSAIYLQLAANTIIDFAMVPNGNSAVTLQEGSPGNISSSTCMTSTIVLMRVI